MDFSEFFGTVKDKISSLIETVKDFCVENKKMALTFLGLGIIFVGGIIALICVASKPKTEIKTIKPQLILSEKLMYPQGPELTNEYTVSRSPRKSWTTEEAEEWFTVPTQKDIDGLEKANDGIISEILGAAP